MHGGDEGIRAFFQQCFDWLQPGGVLLLEPQPWDGYRKHLKKAKVSSAISSSMVSGDPMVETTSNQMVETTPNRMEETTPTEEPYISMFTDKPLLVRPLPSETSDASFWSILVEEVGFGQGQVIWQPGVDAKSFDRRPLWVFRKGG